MKCVNCYEPIRPTGELDGIYEHDGRYEFGYVHDDGNPFCDLTPVATPPEGSTT